MAAQKVPFNDQRVQVSGTVKRKYYKDAQIEIELILKKYNDLSEEEIFKIQHEITLLKDLEKEEKKPGYKSLMDKYKDGELWMKE